ncbi:hypothetical protein [Romboutsia lituseburensis]|uniref:hypothetical protein n=1 Tax=Romboutsia lituseburensis TaxID=1537 RepID=UPI00215B5183|nr:hypothetical protein [Romboutsia lituseburensis]MCR8743896.1 hypothetical protein [Romboutsia lituseburensis]
MKRRKSKTKKRYKREVIYIFGLIVGLVLGIVISPKGVSKKDFFKVSQELDYSKSKIIDLNRDIDNLNDEISQLRQKEKSAKIWFELDDSMKQKIKEYVQQSESNENENVGNDKLENDKVVDEKSSTEG